MANRKVSIWMYVKVGSRWRYVKPFEGRNHKLKPGFALIGGLETHAPDAAYYIRFREGKKIVWQKCRNAADATLARERQEAYLAAYAHGLTPVQQTAPLPKMVSHHLDGWLEEYRLSHGKESYSLMKQTLHEFFGYWDEKGRRIRGFCEANIIEQVRRVDLLRYRAWLIEKKRSARTAANKMMRVNQFVRSILELPEGKGRVTVKDGKFVEMEPTVFNDDELKAFFECCDSFHFAVFKTYLMAGLRKAELESLSWDDVDFSAGTITVSPKLDFTPKDWGLTCHWLFSFVFNTSLLRTAVLGSRRHSCKDSSNGHAAEEGQEIKDERTVHQPPGVRPDGNNQSRRRLLV